MKLFKTVAFGAIAAALTACSSAPTVTRNAPLAAVNASAQIQPQTLRDYDVHSIRFSVPDDMTVSEANSYYPIADIVWRGDPLGNRSQQIADMFQTSIQAAGANLNGQIPVTVEVTLARFHSMTERTRYSVGGTHSIKFDLTVRNALTGEVLEQTRRIDGDFPGLGGNAALAADSAGQTQKVRVLTHLTNLFSQELTGVAGPQRNRAAGT